MTERLNFAIYSSCFACPTHCVRVMSQKQTFHEILLEEWEHLDQEDAAITAQIKPLNKKKDDVKKRKREIESNMRSRFESNEQKWAALSDGRVMELVSQQVKERLTKAVWERAITAYSTRLNELLSEALQIVAKDLELTPDQAHRLAEWPALDGVGQGVTQDLLDYVTNSCAVETTNTIKVKKPKIAKDGE